MWKYFRTITLTKKDSAKDPKRNLFIRVCFLFGPIFMCLAHILHNLESAVMYFFVSLETIFFHYFCLFSVGSYELSKTKIELKWLLLHI